MTLMVLFLSNFPQMTENMWYDICLCLAGLFHLTWLYGCLKAYSFF
jgi:hypothetical protein